MKAIKTFVPLLLASAVLATPAYANYFSSSKWNTVLAIGSAPSPTPETLRRIGDSPYAPAARTNAPAQLNNIPAEDEDLNGNTYEDEENFSAAKQAAPTVRVAETRATPVKKQAAIHAKAQPAKAKRTLASNASQAKASAKPQKQRTLAANTKSKKRAIRG